MIETIASLVGSSKVKLTLTAIFSVFLQFSGADMKVYQAIFIMVTIDTITGVWVARNEKRVSSKGFFGVIKKMFLFIMMLIASHQLGVMVEELLVIQKYVAIFLICNEMVSIAENTHKLGVPYPPWFNQILEKYLEINQPK